MSRVTCHVSVVVLLQLGEEEKQQKEKVTWDGHTASMEKVTQKARENISIEQQIAVIHKTKGLVCVPLQPFAAAITSQFIEKLN